MFIRWQKRNRRRSVYGRTDKGGDVHWQAILAETRRVDGRPVQRHIAVVAAFVESQLPIDAQRGFIWEDIDNRLDRLGNQITKAERKRIEAVIATKVPRLSRRQYTAIARRNAKKFGPQYLSPKQRAALGLE
jgi:hypothetical protein